MVQKKPPYEFWKSKTQNIGLCKCLNVHLKIGKFSDFFFHIFTIAAHDGWVLNTTDVLFAKSHRFFFSETSNFYIHTTFLLITNRQNGLQLRNFLIPGKSSSHSKLSMMEPQKGSLWWPPIRILKLWRATRMSFKSSYMYWREKKTIFWRWLLTYQIFYKTSYYGCEFRFNDKLVIFIVIWNKYIKFLRHVSALIRHGLYGEYMEQNWTFEHFQRPEYWV
jgi:hypothetical protein